MLNRRHIRIKILQLLYAKKTGNIDNVSLLKQFDLASTNFYKFFLTQLLLFKEIFIESERIFNINKNKYFKNEDNLIEDLFLKNELLLFLNSNKFLIKAEEQFKLNYWKLNINKVQNIFKIIIKHEVITNYSNKKINSYQLVQDIYKNIIVCNEELFNFYEDNELGWSDDFPLVNTLILSWLTNFSIDQSLKIPRKIFKDRSDKKFGKDLFKIVVKDKDETEKIINDYTPDWDNDRIAVIDKIILKMCIYEFTSFPSIPVKVSINEYVEISKEYSSPNSSTFINGVINNIYKNLLEKDLIKKNERGLQ